MAGPAEATVLGLIHAEASRLTLAGAALAARTPPPWAALLAGVGLVYLLHGARNRHVLAIPGGAVLGAVAARLGAFAFGAGGAAVQPELLWVSAGAGAFACGAWPPLFPPLALAVPGLVAGWAAPLGVAPWLGALAGGAAGAAAGALMREWVAALAAGGIGAAAVIAGGLGLLARRPAGQALLGHPMALLAIWTVLAVAGAAFHAGRAWPGRGSRPPPGGLQPDRPVHEGIPEYDGWRG